MKKFLIIAAGIAALSVSMPAIAQDVTDTTCSACGNGVDTTLRGIIIDVSAGAGHAGKFEAMGDAGVDGVVSALAKKEGGAYSVFDIVYDSCNEGDCGAARVTANVGGYEVGESMATASTAKPGQWAVAQNVGIAQTAGALNVTFRSPTTTHTQNGQ